MTRSILSSTLVLLSVSVFEAAVLSNVTILPSLPDFSLLCVLFFSVQNGKLIGETTGFISGLFLDFLSASPFGLNCLYRSILGYVSGIFNKELNIDGFIVPAILAFFATLMKALLIFIISILFPSSVFAYKIFSMNFLLELGMNTFLSPFCFKFLSIFKNSIVIRPEEI